MRKILREAGEQSPFVHFDKGNAVLEIRGYSFPDNALDFYSDLIDWVKEYSEEPNAETHMIFDFNYVNSTSIKFIHEILKKLDVLHDAGKVALVSWFYAEDDEDIQQLGMTLKEFHKLPFVITAKKVGPEKQDKKFF